jgi:hypothetical protein
MYTHSHPSPDQQKNTGIQAPLLKIRADIFLQEKQFHQGHFDARPRSYNTGGTKSLSGRPFTTRCNAFLSVSATGPFFGATRGGRTSLGVANDPKTLKNVANAFAPDKFWRRFSGRFSSRARRFCRAFLEVSGTQGNALQKRRPFFSRCKRRRLSTPLQTPGGYQTGSKTYLAV